MSLTVLVSYAFIKDKPSLLDSVPSEWRILLDSGAYTNFTTGRNVVTLDAYADWLSNNRNRVWRYLNLDVMNDPKSSSQNLAALKSAGLSPVPVFQRGDTARSLVEMVNENDLTAIGGISRNISSNATQRYLDSVMRICQGHKVHLLGVGLREMKRHAPFSADSSSWDTIGRFKTLSLWHDGAMIKITKDRKQMATPRYLKPDLKRARALASYGVDWDFFADFARWQTGSAGSVLQARSWVRASKAMGRLGSTYVFACKPDMIQTLVKAYEIEANQLP